MGSLPIEGSKGSLSKKEAEELVREKKSSGYKAFLENDPNHHGDRKYYQVIWYLG